MTARIADLEADGGTKGRDVGGTNAKVARLSVRAHPTRTTEQSVPSREARATTTVGTADPDGGVRAKEPPVSDYALISRTARAAQRLWGVSLVRGAVAIAVGVFLLIDAAATFTVLVWLLGALLVVDGLVATVGALRSPKDEAGAARSWWIVLGALSIVAGVVVMVWPNRTVTLFVWVVAIWALVAGLFGTAGALRARARGDAGWDWRLAIALITLVLGVVVITHTDVLAETLALVLAVYLLAGGIVQLVASISLRDQARRLAAAAAAAA